LGVAGDSARWPEIRSEERRRGTRNEERGTRNVSRKAEKRAPKVEEETFTLDTADQEYDSSDEFAFSTSTGFPTALASMNQSKRDSSVLSNRRKNCPRHQHRFRREAPENHQTGKDHRLPPWQRLEHGRTKRLRSRDEEKQKPDLRPRQTTTSSLRRSSACGPRRNRKGISSRRSSSKQTAALMSREEGKKEHRCETKTNCSSSFDTGQMVAQASV